MKYLLAIVISLLIGVSAITHQEELRNATGDLQEMISSTISEATTVFQDWVPALADKDPNEELTYEDQLNIVQDIYAKYDNGDLKEEELFSEYLKGYDEHVNDLNSYHDFLDECGVPGPNVQIDIRGNKNAE